MPLDDIARRYAEQLFVQRVEALSREQDERLTSIAREYAARGLSQSGMYMSARAQAGVGRIERIARAREESLLAAYEKAGRPLTDEVIEEVIREVEPLCETQRKALIRQMSEDIRHTFGTPPSGLAAALAGEVERGVSRIVSDIGRELAIRRNEAILDGRRRMPVDQGIIFISCGQVTPEEKDLGRAVAQLVNELTPYMPYFAENQATLEAVTENILKALNRCVGFIAIMHPRGRVVGLEGKEHLRASVWIEQEIAIAAFLSQALERQLKVSLCTHKEVFREGLRDKLHLNPFVFTSNEQVITHLRQILPSWQGLGARNGSQPVFDQLRTFAEHKTIVRIKPAIPRAAEQKDFQVLSADVDAVVVKQLSSDNVVSIPARRIHEVLPQSGSDPPRFLLDGRLQWITPLEVWKFFDEKPPVDSFFGFSRPSHLHDPEATSIIERMRQRGYEFAWASERDLPSREGSEYRTVYGEDGRYFRIPDSPHGLILARKIRLAGTLMGTMKVRLP